MSEDCQMTKPDAQSEAELGHYALGVRAPMRLAGSGPGTTLPALSRAQKGPSRAPLEVSLRR